MKRFALIMLIVVLTVSSCCGFYYKVTNTSVLSSSNKMSKTTIVIDAGHGGRDVGAVGIDGSLESKINLDISFKLYDFLMVSGISTVMTRYGDYQTYYDKNANRNKSDLYYRLDFVNEINNSILVSIHQNHYVDEKECGTQIWYAPNSPKSKKIADSIMTNVVSFLQPNNKRVNKESDSNYYILFKATHPSIMVECGFISNSIENAKLQDEKYQNDLAFSIFSGVYGEL